MPFTYGGIVVGIQITAITRVALRCMCLAVGGCGSGGAGEKKVIKVRLPL